jgi:multiple sugar transport system substrate-binding protein
VASAGLVLLATACSSSGGGSGSGQAGGSTTSPSGGGATSAAPVATGGSADSGADVTLSYALWDPNQVSAMKADAAAFHTQHPNITVNVQQTDYADYFTKLKTAVSGGAAPDVFWMNGPNFQLYASNGVLAPIDDVITSNNIDLGNYPKAMVDLYNFKGKQYGIPKDFDTVGVWYNKTLFDAAGVAYPKPNWTWADFQAAAKKLTDPSKGIYGIGAELEGQEYYYNTIYQAGGYVISPDGKKSGYDDPNTIKGLQFWTDLIKDKVSPDLKTMTDTTPLSMFESGKTAMYWGGSWDAAEFGKNDYTKDKVDVAPLPTGAKQAVIIHGLANVISAKTAHPKEAGEFVAYLASKDAADTLAAAGVIPAFNGTQSTWLAKYPEFHLQYFLDELPYAVPYPISQNTAAWNEAETKYLTMAWSGQEDVAQAAKQLADAMNADLAKEQ